MKQGLGSLGLDTAAVPQLTEFARRLLEKNKVMNLTAITEPKDVATLHLLDSAWLLTAADCRGKTLVDVGTGAGFPGMPMGILEPTAQLTLLTAWESALTSCRRRPRLCTCKTSPAYSARAEEFAGSTGRASTWPCPGRWRALPMLCELAMPLVKTEGLFLAMKSVESDGEIESARGAIGQLGGKIEKILDYTVPCTEVRHRVVVIRKVRPTPSQFPRPFAKIKKSPLK